MSAELQVPMEAEPLPRSERTPTVHEKAFEKQRLSRFSEKLPQTRSVPSAWCHASPARALPCRSGQAFPQEAIVRDPPPEARLARDQLVVVGSDSPV